MRQILSFYNAVASPADLEYLFLGRRHPHDQRWSAYDQDRASVQRSAFVLRFWGQILGIPSDGLDVRAH
jgi:hypothetical protein